MFCIIARELWKLTHHALVSSRLISSEATVRSQTVVVKWVMTGGLQHQTLRLYCIQCITVELQMYAASSLFTRRKPDDTFWSRRLFYQKKYAYLEVFIISYAIMYHRLSSRYSVSYSCPTFRLICWYKSAVVVRNVLKNEVGHTSRNSSFLMDKILHVCSRAFQNLIHDFGVPNHLMWCALCCCMSFITFSGTTENQLLTVHLV